MNLSRVFVFSPLLCKDSQSSYRGRRMPVVRRGRIDTKMLEEHMKNKIAAVLLSGLLALGAVACSGSGSEESSEGGGGAEETTS